MINNRFVKTTNKMVLTRMRQAMRITQIVDHSFFKE